MKTKESETLCKSCKKETYNTTSEWSGFCSINCQKHDRNIKANRKQMEHYKLTLIEKNFKEALAIKTGCTSQFNGWTCGTCFYAISKKLNHDDWKSLLFYRGDYNDLEVGIDIPKTYMSNIIKIGRIIGVKE